MLDVPDPQKELFNPAVNGTLHFLRSCKAAGVEKVVLTSSIAAVTDEGRPGYVFSERDFNSKSTLTRLPYFYSKTEAEKAAWKFVEEEAPDMKLIAINPVVMIGPNVTSGQNFSVQSVVDIAKGRFMGIIDMEWTISDVRDVSNAHILAMESETAEGRYICGVSDCPMHFREIVDVLIAKGFKPPTRDLSSAFMTNVIKAASYIIPGGQQGVVTRSMLAYPVDTSSAKIEKDLGMTLIRRKLSKIRLTLSSSGVTCKTRRLTLCSRVF